MRGYWWRLDAWLRATPASTASDPVFWHVSGLSEKHLHGYLAAFDFKYNNRVSLGVVAYKNCCAQNCESKEAASWK